MKKIIILFTISIFLTMAACAQNKTENLPVNEANKTVSTATPTPNIANNLKENECKICNYDFTKYKGELKKEEVDGLLLALNDEFLAFATYDQINKDFNNPRPFINIQQAEARHSERLKMLFTTYKLEIPENPWLGKTPKFASVAEACKAGIDAEIVNKQLYDKLFKSTAREDILFVYKNLQRASEENHLPAFQRCGNGGVFGHGRGYGGGRGF
ncbi:MAG TPA: hypothetical protein PKY59_14305 [Pyrinomonadaceae bacterium]|nr:hypothetical protein [Pyrinomonadaceae bacterium]